MTRQFVADGVYASLLLCENVKYVEESRRYTAIGIFSDTTMFMHDGPVQRHGFAALGMVVLNGADRGRYEIEIVSWHEKSPDKRKVEHSDAVAFEGVTLQHPIGVPVVTELPPGRCFVGVMVNRRLRGLASFLSVPRAVAEQVRSGELPPR